MFLTGTQPTSPNRHGYLVHRSRLSSLRPQEALAVRLVDDGHTQIFCRNERQFLSGEAPSRGSVIGPLVFLLRINDLKATPDDSHFLLINNSLDLVGCGEDVAYH